MKTADPHKDLDQPRPAMKAKYPLPDPTLEQLKIGLQQLSNAHENLPYSELYSIERFAHTEYTNGADEEMMVVANHLGEDLLKDYRFGGRFTTVNFNLCYIRDHLDKELTTDRDFTNSMTFKQSMIKEKQNLVFRKMVDWWKLLLVSEFETKLKIREDNSLAGLVRQFLQLFSSKLNIHPHSPVLHQAKKKALAELNNIQD